MIGLFERYADLISSATVIDITADPSLDGRLNLEQCGPLVVSYSPFDHINSTAKVVLVGITPGRQQAINALIEARRQLKAGTDFATASKAAKETASFSGSMRPNLIGMLDAIGLPGWLGIESSKTLFGAHAHLVHYTSALRYPVYINGENYSGQPNMTTHPVLQRYISQCLAEEMQALPTAVWVPLGPKPAAALSWLAQKGMIDSTRILDGLPHPSGANAERVAYFLGRKARVALSTKTNPDSLDAARAKLLQKMRSLMAVSYHGDAVSVW